ncbi:uncharacterized protein LOC127719001 [Mytilus californianus]|uniref:uncharacterized protein LOC127719001 n=1 Tax=Mytilus californianus TaxID=6549 RepID=UPI0022450BC6|nr:uncharacterized protein LOC127719001 [Mytilus californianus]
MTGEYTCFAVNSMGTGSSLPVQLTVQAGITQQAPIKEYAEKRDHTNTVTLGIVGGIAAVAGVVSCVIACLAYMYKRRTGAKEIMIANNIGLEQNDSPPRNLPLNIRHSELQSETED